MTGEELAPGLWRWTVPHPDWKERKRKDSPDDWPRDVGCVLAHAGDRAVLIDPLVPDEAGWRWLEERTGGRPVTVLETIRYHRRSRDEAVERFEAATDVPDGVEAFVLRGAAETVYWLPEHAALVPGDRIIGADGGGLRMCPESWMDLSHDALAERLEPLLDLPVERVLVSHGEPVLSGARDALRAAARRS